VYVRDCKWFEKGKGVRVGSHQQSWQCYRCDGKDQEIHRWAINYIVEVSVSALQICQDSV